LTLNQIADLLQRDKSVISKHTKNIFDTGELDPARTVAKFATVQTEGVTRQSPRGAQFRQWATSQLKEYLVKGFAMDD